MKIVLIVALSFSMAVPVVATIVPTSVEAQVLAGRSAARNATRRPRPALSEREYDRLYAAQDEIVAIEQAISEIQTTAEAQGGATAEQSAALQMHQGRLAEQQEIVARLEAKRDRRS